MPRACLLVSSLSLGLTSGFSPSRWLRKQFYSVDRNREDRWVLRCGFSPAGWVGAARAIAHLQAAASRTGGPASSRVGRWFWHKELPAESPLMALCELAGEARDDKPRALPLWAEIDGTELALGVL